jgi:uncharacterized protein (TIRG00374 family)
MRWRHAAILIAGAALLVALYAVLGVDDVIATLRHVRPGLCTLYLGLGALACLAYSARWRAVARALGDAPPLRRFVEARLAGDAVGAVMPIGRVGGDPVRVALLYGEGVPGARAGAGVVMDRIIEFIGNSVCAVTYVAVFSFAHTLGASRHLSVAAGGAIAVPVLALAALLWRLRRGHRPLSELLELAGAERWERSRHALEALRHSEDDMARFLRGHPRTFIASVLASLGIEALAVVQYAVLLAAFGLVLSLPTLLMVMVLSGMARAVPVPAGLGALEASQVALLAATGGSAEIGLVVGTVLRLHETLWTTIGFVVLSARGMSLARLRLVMSARRVAA